MKLITRPVPINQYPDPSVRPQIPSANHLSVTFGDMHSNVGKFIHSLMIFSIIDFKPEVVNPSQEYQNLIKLTEDAFLLLSKDTPDSYMKTLYGLNFVKDRQDEKSQEKAHELTLLLNSYYTNTDLRKEYVVIIEMFKRFLGLLEIKDRSKLVRLLGDEMADKGGVNDYLMLLFLFFLDEQGLQITIMCSNHGVEFIRYYQAICEMGFFIPTIEESHTGSLWGLDFLIKSSIIGVAELQMLVERSYKPKLKLIDYEEGIGIYTHAPIKFDCLKSLARKFNVEYPDNVSEPNFFDRFSEAINTSYQINPQGLDLMNEFYPTNSGASPEDCDTWPLFHLIWYRTEKNKPSNWSNLCDITGRRVLNVHGHDGSEGFHDGAGECYRRLSLNSKVGSSTPAMESKQSILDFILVTEKPEPGLKLAPDSPKKPKIPIPQHRLNLSLQAPRGVTLFPAPPKVGPGPEPKKEDTNTLRPK